MKKKIKKGVYALPGMRTMRCPYCGSPVALRSADGIYKENRDGSKLYVCSRYPACDAYVRAVPGTNTPAGSLASAELRSLRIEAHRSFDKLHQSGILSRQNAYNWLAVRLQIPRSQAHIGYFSEYYCKLVIEESDRYFENHRRSDSASESLRKAAGGETYAAGR